MSDFTKSIVYSGLVLMAGLIAVFAISSTMHDEAGTGRSLSSLEPASGAMTFEPVAMDMPGQAEETAPDATLSEAAEWDAEEALEQLRAALKEAGVELSDVEPAAGDEQTGHVHLDTIGANE